MLPIPPLSNLLIDPWAYVCASRCDVALKRPHSFSLSLRMFLLRHAVRQLGQAFCKYTASYR